MLTPCSEGAFQILGGQPVSPMSVTWMGSQLVLFLFFSGTRVEHRAQGNTVHLLPLRQPVSDLVSCI